MPDGLLYVISGSWLGDRWFPHSAVFASLTWRYGNVMFLFVRFLLPYQYLS